LIDRFESDVLRPCFGAEPLPARLWSEAITMQVVVLCSAAPDVVRLHGGPTLWLS